MVFVNKKSFFLQVIYSTTHWLRMWGILQQPTSQDTLVAASHFLAQVVMIFFAQAYGGGLVIGLAIINVSVLFIFSVKGYVLL